MNVITAWLFLAFVVERVTEAILTIFPILQRLQEQTREEVKIPLIIALLVSIVIAYGAGMDFFQMFKIEFQWPYVGQAISAVIMAMGASPVHDIINWLQTKKENEKQKAA